MKRTQLYIDKETYLDAKLLAKKKGKTVSQITRAALKEYVKKNKMSKDYDSLAEILKLGEKFPSPPGTPTDMSINHDHYLYGTPKRKTVK